MNYPKIIVIGGGPGGYVAAIKAAQLGGKVTLIEKADIGGTCLNRGCMPTKALLHSADLYKTSSYEERYGIVFDNVSLNWEKVQQYRASIVEQLTGGVKSLLRANKVEIVYGEASFSGEKSVIVNGKEYCGDYIIIATGSAPIIPKISGVDIDKCINSTECLQLDDIPDSLAIIGGGVIGIELGYAYSCFGTKVTIFEKEPTILPTMEAELTTILTKYLENTGMSINTNCEVSSIEDRGQDALLRVNCHNEITEYAAKKVLLCVGRKSLLEGLYIEKTGIDIENGQIKTDSFLQTNVKGIYAIGDCTGKAMFAHAAIAMGEIAAENIFGYEKEFNADLVPSCCYVGPEFAGVGLTEKEAKNQGIDYKVGRFPTLANGRSLVAGATEGMVKTIIGKQYGEILGVHILAANATELIQQATLAIQQELSAEELKDIIACHPTVSEALRESILSADGCAIHNINR